MRDPFAEFIKNELGPETLLITCGLPATWKTETSEEVSKIKGYPILRSDLIRLEVLKNEDVFDPKVAGNMSKRLSVYDEMFRRADDLAGKRKGLILDATFVTQELRRRAAEIAAKHGLTFVILETSCPTLRRETPRSHNEILRRLWWVKAQRASAFRSCLHSVRRAVLSCSGIRRIPVIKRTCLLWHSARLSSSWLCPSAWLKSVVESSGL